MSFRIDKWLYSFSPSCFPSPTVLFGEQLQELEDKYAECIEMLHEAQEELKNLRNKTLPYSTPRRIHPLAFFPTVGGLSGPGPVRHGL